MKLTHLSLFSGIGGIDIAAEKAGFITVGQCEQAEYPLKVLSKHWSKVPKWSDVNELSAKSFRDRTGIDRPTLISGGFPCQPFSVAGNQKGEEDSRYLWPSMLSVITSLTPDWVIGENVPGIIPKAGESICKDLEHAGYSVGIFNIEAACIGANHRRARIFFVAHANSAWELQPQGGIEKFRERLGNSSQNVSDSDNRSRVMRGNREFSATSKPERAGDYNRRGTQEHEPRKWGQPEPGMGRVVDGISVRMDPSLIIGPEPNIPRLVEHCNNREERLKALGNAVVPAQVYPILAAIAEVEKLIIRNIKQ